MKKFFEENAWTVWLLALAVVGGAIAIGYRIYRRSTFRTVDIYHAGTANGLWGNGSAVASDGGTDIGGGIAVQTSGFHLFNVGDRVKFEVKQGEGYGHATTVTGEYEIEHVINRKIVALKDSAFPGSTPPMRGTIKLIVK